MPIRTEVEADEPEASLAHITSGTVQLRPLHEDVVQLVHLVCTKPSHVKQLEDTRDEELPQEHGLDESRVLL
eukprot:864073-Rhodomonas_salina.1